MTAGELTKEGTKILPGEVLVVRRPDGEAAVGLGFRSERGVISLIHYPSIPCVWLNLRCGSSLLICWI